MRATRTSFVVILTVVGLCGCGGPKGDAPDRAASPLAAIQSSITKYVEVGLAGDREGVVAVCVADSPIVDQALDGLKQIPDARGLASVVECRADDSSARAVSASVEDDRGRSGNAVFSLVRQGDTWLIEDIDFEDPEGVAKEIARYEAKHPQAKALLSGR